MKITGNKMQPARSRQVKAVTAGTSITSGANRRSAMPIMSSTMKALSPEKRQFAQQLQRNARRASQSIMAATNTTNIMARPDFIELLPMFVQKLLVTDVFGSIAMKSRQQLIPYFKFIAENDKGETNAGKVLSSPFANRQADDHFWTSRTIKNEVLSKEAPALVYTPVLPGSVTVQATAAGTVTAYFDDGEGVLKSAEGTKFGTIEYATGAIKLEAASDAPDMKATYQYDNENVGPRANSSAGFGYEYGAQMAKGYLQLDEINLVAEAHELACYWSVYSAFAAQAEYGASIGDMAKEASISQITAEINSYCFDLLANSAKYRPQMNFDASPVLAGTVVPSDYLNMFKLKLHQASASVYQATQLTRPNRMVVGTNAAAYISMIEGFQSAGTSDNVGPYKLGSLDEFEIYVAPNYDPDLYVLSCKSDDIRRNSALFGEYMPVMNTDAIGLANMSVQQGAATMYGTKIVNPDTVVSGRILGSY